MTMTIVAVKYLSTVLIMDTGPEMSLIPTPHLVLQHRW